MTTAQSVEFMMGISFFFLGLSCLLYANIWLGWLEHLKQNPQQSAVKLGSVNLALGAFVLGFHWIWRGGPIVATILGALIALRGVIHLLYPSWFLMQMKIIERCEKPALRWSGLLILILGAYIFYDVLMQPSVQDYLCAPFSCRASGQL